MMLVLNKRTLNTFSVEIINDEGEPVHQSLLNRFKDKDIRWLCKVWGESVTTVTQKANEICESELDSDYEPQVIDFNPDADLIKSIVSGTEVIHEQQVTADPITIRVRALDQLSSHSVNFTDSDTGTALQRAFQETWTHANDPSNEFLIEWSDVSKLSCLDIDYHSLDMDSRPTAEELDSVISAVEPQPFCWHPSHGKGAKLYYVNQPGYTAKELASVAGISYLEKDATATFEIVKSSRHPCYNRKRDNICGITFDKIKFIHGNSNLSNIKAKLTSEVEPDTIAAWLYERGYSIGSTLPHTHCPIDPTEDIKDNVYVGDKGLFCHRCFAKGYGSTAGFTSYANLIGCSDNRLTTMVRNFCHLEHARVVLENIYPNIAIKVLEDVYRVMLKVLHSVDDPRIQLAMRSGTGYIRTLGQWVSISGDSTLSHGVKDYVHSLPATMYVKKTGKDAGNLAPDVARLTAFQNDGNLEDYGYPDISFIRGCKIYGHFNAYPQSEVVKVISRREFSSVKPKYITPSLRMPIEEAWQLLDSEFPGINRNYVKLLICSKGASEGRLAQCPFLLISGPSSAGKSTTAHIAAGICGDKADEPIWNPNTERFRQSLMDSAKHSGFVCVNEVFKYADNAKLNYIQAIDPMLSLTEDSRSHVLYIGSVPFGRLPVFVLTDINIPPEVVQDKQISRRFQFYRLESEANWTDSLVNRQIRPHQFRLISHEHTAAADSILSDVIDTYFQVPQPLSHIAEQLQICTLQNYAEDVDRTKDLLQDFYNAVIAGPYTSGTHARRYKPEQGWKVIDRMCNSPLLDLWNEVCDGQEPDKWNRSRKIDSQDWSKLLGLPFPIMVEYRSLKCSAVYIRFRSSGSPNSITWMNGVAV